jgi:hypothetical protein
MHALSGVLEHFPPVQILRLLQMSGASGRLELVRGEERAEVFLNDGRPSFARTNGQHSRLGDVLVGSGDIRPEAIELTVAVQQDQPGERMGAMLVESGIVDHTRMREAVLEVQRRIVCRVLLWRDGEFRFHPGEHAANEDITLALDLDGLIIEALRSAEAHGENGENRIAA